MKKRYVAEQLRIADQQYGEMAALISVGWQTADRNIMVTKQQKLAWRIKKCIDACVELALAVGADAEGNLPENGVFRPFDLAIEKGLPLTSESREQLYQCLRMSKQLVELSTTDFRYLNPNYDATMVYSFGVSMARVFEAFLADVHHWYALRPIIDSEKTTQGSALLCELRIQWLRCRIRLGSRSACLQLERINIGNALKPLIATLNNSNPKARQAAALALGNLKDGRAVDPLIATLKDPDPTVRKAATITLSLLGYRRAIESLHTVLKDENPTVRDAASRAIREFQTKASKTMNPDGSESKSGQTAVKGTRRPQPNAVRTPGAKPFGRLIENLASSKSDLRLQSLDMLTTFMWSREPEVRAEAMEAVASALKHDDLETVRIAVRGLIEVGEIGIRYLINAAKDTQLRTESRMFIDSRLRTLQLPDADKDKNVRHSQEGRAHSSDYGLSENNPILCGHGPEGEKRYLGRLRCPSGTPVTFQRLGSVSVSDLSYIQKAGLQVNAQLVELGKLTNGPVCVTLDQYRIVCGCGAHTVQVFMDMYHAGSDDPIGQPGWSLES